MIHAAASVKRLRVRATIAAAVVVVFSIAVGHAFVPAAPVPFAVAFYNIRSGKGAQPLRGAPEAPFAESDSCDPSRPPLNAWGNGVVQRELAAALGSRSDVVALGLAEAWHCAAPARVRAALGWKEASDERNGTAIVARYGFSGERRWLKLDTSRNKNPRDEMWVVRAPVCLDQRCSASIDVYVTHWSGTGPDGQATFIRQAEDTVGFMAASHGPHVLIGDLNVFEGDGPVCGQHPNNSTLTVLRNGGYTDAWARVHGSDEGYTGMVNRRRCGEPEGYTWKRIDYAWSKELTPAAMSRFGVVPPGHAAPSDHYGIVAEFR
jgi:exonuclease III